MTWEWLLILIIPVVLYILYLNGYLMYQNKAALMFIGGFSAKSAKFTACHGTIKQIIRVKDSRYYHFVLQPNVTSGEVEARILDRDRNCLCTLNQFQTSADLMMEAKQRYYLQVVFRKASGSYQIAWQ